ncbi:hypothetical protein QC762_0077180 [Podospora pseudocomata]|uniref:Long-chain-alcohol oxidase n=1 Tax=Podospora pseudocomata TaxID=2093779 RepID=A0ABR0GAP6_9PEZI|nr:hypothetical protein QC762_0077180 [Podospora pseudocomata]
MAAPPPPSSFSSSSLSSPKEIPLPDSIDFLSESQWAVFMALMDTIAPAILPPKSIASSDNNAPDDKSVLRLSQQEYAAAASEIRAAVSPHEVTAETIESYLRERPSDNPMFEKIMKLVLSGLPPSKKRELKILLSVLSTRPGSLILTSYGTPLPQLGLEDRTRVLEGWRESRLWAVRGLFKSMTTLGKLGFLRSSNTFAPLTGFPSVPKEWVATSSFPFEFIRPTAEVETDVVIIGSGCGSGVVTNRLANMFGKRVKVLVLEKGGHFDASYFPMSQTVGLSAMFEAGGVVESDDGSITVTAGSCFGGGGTVNWSASLQPQDFVRKDWAETYKMPFFEGREFQECLDHVWEKMGVTDKITPNHGNQVLLNGGRQTGCKRCKIVPQNTRGQPHNCGYCTLGCANGEKMGPVNGWFPEAAEKGAVEFMEGFRAERVLFDEKRKSKKVACGVAGVWTPKEGGEPIKVVVKAKKVVVSAGTLWSPVVLMNSGIKNPQVGKNLYLHPVNFVAGVFDEDIRPWEGGSLTTVVGDFEDLDGKGHGVKLEAMSMMPSLALPFLTWRSGSDYKLMAAKYRHINQYISIIRDRDTGYIYRDPYTGDPRISYTPSDFDRAHNFVGVLELCKILHATGAREIHPCLPGFQPFVRSQGDSKKTDKAFKKWLRKLKKYGNKPPVAPFVSAHQMGTCRMSAKAKDGVVDPRGRVWDTEGLYVADASVFPTASGVNPMVTTMALADWVARGICEDIKDELVVEKVPSRL